MAARFPRPTLYAAAVLAMVALLFGGSIWVVHGSDDGKQSSGPHLPPRRGTPAPLISPPCPDVYAKQAPWVPIQEAGLDRHSRLAPRTIPTSALICRYSAKGGHRLSGVRPVTEGLAGLTTDLTWMPRSRPHQAHACTLMAKRLINYLVRLTYRDRTSLWVSATDDVNHCTDTSNGDFRSWASPGLELTTAFRSGRWPQKPAPTCMSDDIGRLGQDTAMVPAGSTAVTICGRDVRGRTLSSGYGRLITALNELPARTSQRHCSPSPSASAPIYDLQFAYPEGPDVAVTVMGGCFPEVDNLSLQSRSARTILPIVGQLLKGTP